MSSRTSVRTPGAADDEPQIHELVGFGPVWREDAPSKSRVSRVCVCVLLWTRVADCSLNGSPVRATRLEGKDGSGGRQQRRLPGEGWCHWP